MGDLTLPPFPPTPSIPTPTRVWSRQEVASAIASGDTLLIYADLLLRIPPSWLAAHPGGQLAILHFVGRDATGEMDGFHSPETLAVRVRRFAVGVVDDGKDWEPLVPPLAAGWVRRPGAKGMEWVNEAGSAPDAGLLVPLSPSSAPPPAPAQPPLSALEPPPTTVDPPTESARLRALRALHAEITAANLYATPYITGYGPDALRYVFFGALAALAFRAGWFKVSAAALGVMWHQLTFTAHDLGHCGVTHSWAADRMLGIVVADLLGGLSIGWWVDNHNIHHLVTNHPSHDPDIQHVPFFAITPRFFSTLYSTYYGRAMPFDLPSRLFIRVQPYLYYLVLSLARFNLYAQSYAFLARGTRGKHRLAELLCIALFWLWFSLILYHLPSPPTRLTYFLISQIVPFPVHVQIVQSHFSRSTLDLGPAESFPSRQLRTTTDVLCPPPLAFLHGGLHLQVTHHLFPRLPRHNLKRASGMVKAWAGGEGMEYAEMGIVRTNGEVLGVLSEVAAQVDVWVRVARAEARGELSMGH